MSVSAKYGSTLAVYPALLLIVAGSACDDDHRSSMTLRLDTDLPGIEIRVSFDGESRIFEADDFSERRIADEFEVANSGPIEFDVRLVDGGILAAEGSVVFQLRESTSWGVRFFRQVDDPSLRCFGCEGSEAFPIEPSVAHVPGEAIWVAWGGSMDGVIF